MDQNILIKTLEQFEASELDALRQHRLDGGKACGTFCRRFPKSLLAGLDLWPLRVASGATQAAESRGEQFVRPDVCPYCKTLIGNLSLREGVHRHIDLIVGLMTCDMMRRSLETMERTMGIPVFPLQFPATLSINAKEYFLAQTERLVRDVSDFLNAEFDAQKASAYRSAEMEAAAVLEQTALSGGHPPTVVHRLLHLVNVSRPAVLLQFLKTVLPSLPVWESRMNVMILGSVLCKEDAVVLEMLEERRIGAVLNTCTGLAMLANERTVPLEPASIRETIRGITEESWGAPVCIRQRPNHAFYDRTLRVLKSTGCRGIILKTLKFCDPWFTEKEQMKTAFDVPVLVLDTTFSESEHERVRNRLDAFLETIG